MDVDARPLGWYAPRVPQPPVLVIHGYFTPRITNAPIHAALRAKGRRSFDVPIPGMNTQDIARSSDLVHEAADRARREAGGDRVDLFGVSMGGVIAAHYVLANGGHRHVRRTVTLGSPLRGTEAAAFISKLPIATTASRQMAPDSSIIRAIALGTAGETEDGEPIDADIVSIHAEGDPVVRLESTQLPGIRSVKAPIGRFPLGHHQLVIDPRNLRFALDHLD